MNERIEDLDPMVKELIHKLKVSLAVSAGSLNPITGAEKYFEKPISELDDE